MYNTNTFYSTSVTSIMHDRRSDISPESPSRSIEWSMENSAPAKVLIDNLSSAEKITPETDIKERDVITTPVSVETSITSQESSVAKPTGFFQRMKERKERMAADAEQAQKERNEMMQQIENQCSQIRISLNEIERKSESLEEARKIMHQTGQGLQVELFEELYKINQTCEAGERKVAENIQMIRFQMANELARKEQIKKVQDVEKELRGVILGGDEGSSDALNNLKKLAEENVVVDNTLAIIGGPDKH